MKNIFLIVAILITSVGYSQSRKTKKLKLKMAQAEYCNHYMQLLETKPEAKKEFELGKSSIEYAKNYKVFSKKWNKNIKQGFEHLKNARILSGAKEPPRSYKELAKDL